MPHLHFYNQITAAPSLPKDAFTHTAVKLSRAAAVASIIICLI